MRSAFVKDRDLIVYVTVLSACLLLPVILLAIGPPPRRAVYAMNEETGPMAAMGREIYERRGPVDLLFFGASIIRAAIAPDLIERQLEASTGRRPTTILCGPNWQGLDAQYVILRDLLPRRKVKYLFLNLPDAVTWSNKPHIALYRVLRLGDDSGFYSGLGLLHASQVYAAEILGAPRQLLSLIRPNLVGEDEAGLLDRLRKSPGPLLGYYGAAPVQDDRLPPLLPGDEMLHEGNSDGGWFRFGNHPLGDYQLNMLAKIGALARQYGAQIVVLNIPIDSDRGRPFVIERMDWSRLLGMQVTVLGIPPALLFKDMSADEVQRFYVDQHLNRNGRRYFSEAIVPALRLLLERTHVSQ
jgi:hypothetical protein